MKKVKSDIIGRYGWLYLPTFLFLFSYDTSVADSIDQVRIHRSPEKTRVVFDLNGPVEHRIFSLDDPKRLVVDIDAATFEVNPKEIDRKSGV